MIKMLLESILGKAAVLLELVLAVNKCIKMHAGRQRRWTMNIFKKKGQLELCNAQKSRQLVRVFPKLLYPTLSLEIAYKKMYLIYCSNMALYTEKQLK